MMNRIIFNGNKLAKQLTNFYKQILKNQQNPPCIHIINIGNNPSSLSYIKKKTQLATIIGIKSQLHQIQQNINSIHIIQSKISNLIDKLNSQKSCNGILLQLPLPFGIDTYSLLQKINPLKDLDCLTQTNKKKVILYKQQAPILPCTPSAVLKILDYNNINVAHQKVTVIGRSNLVGLPLAYLLMKRNATVTICHRHTKTQDIIQHSKNADILITAAGSPNLIKQIKHGGVVIDVGISRVNGQLVGDVSQQCKNTSRFCTPVPGGVGPMTVSILMENSIKLWKIQKNDSK